MIRSIGTLGSVGVFSALLLAGCGGGGGANGTTHSGGSSSTPVTVEMQSALKKYSQNGVMSNFGMSGWVMLNGKQITLNGSGTVNIGAEQANGSFTETVSGTINGTSFNDTLNIAIPFSSAPTSVTAGQSGNIGSASYVVTANGPNSVLITINATSNTSTTIGSAVEQVQSQVQMIYKVDTSGNVTLISGQDQQWVNGTQVIDMGLTF